MKPLAAVLLLVSAGACAGGPVLPSEWRDPTVAEMSNEPVKLAISGDFDGNGKVDGAVIVVSKDGKKEGLLAFMYFSEQEKWFLLDQAPMAKTIFMGLEKYSPGTYPVLCETQAECDRGYKKPLTLKNDTIVYYRPESASSLFVWDAKKATFTRVWESD